MIEHLIFIIFTGLLIVGLLIDENQYRECERIRKIAFMYGLERKHHETNIQLRKRIHCYTTKPNVCSTVDDVKRFLMPTFPEIENTENIHVFGNGRGQLFITIKNHRLGSNEIIESLCNIVPMGVEISVETER